MSYVQRDIAVTFVLQNGVFAESGTNTLTVSGLRASAKISKSGGTSMAEMDLRVWGMTLSTMDQISTLGMRLTLVPKNSVLVAAGDAESGLATVFAGTVVDAYIDFTEQADAKLHVHAVAGLSQQVKAAPPTSYDGPTDVANILASLATVMGVPFLNNGVSVILDRPYFHGSARDQFVQAVEAADVEWNGMEDGTIAVWPKGQSRDGSIPLVSPSSGLVAYPTYNAGGVRFRTLFNPTISFGGQVQLESSLHRASGTWHIYRLDHDLESQLPGGQWFSTVYCYNPSWGAAPIS